MKPTYCPSCASLVCSPSGNSDLLIIGEHPTDLDMQKGRPFSSSDNFVTPGKVLRKELEQVGLSLQDFRCCYLWLHEQNKNENCYKAGYDNILTEAKGKKAILLLGAEVVETFTNYKVMNVSGLRVESSVLSAPLIVASVSPSLALARTVGEIRFAVGQWKKYLEQENLI